MNAGTCYMQLDGCTEPEAWLQSAPSRMIVCLCRGCLDWWLDSADDDQANEPMAWGWTER